MRAGTVTLTGLNFWPSFTDMTSENSYHLAGPKSKKYTGAYSSSPFQMAIIYMKDWKNKLVRGGARR